MPPATDPPRSPAAALAETATAAGLLALTGIALPLGRGLLLPIAATLFALLLAEHQRAVWSRSIAAAGGWPTVLARTHAIQRAAIVALVVLPVAVLATITARACGSLLVAFPAAVWGLVPLAVLAILSPLLVGRARAPMIALVALAIPIAGVLGTRFEAASPEARGYAHSGPILGIHPFQSTAVIVDGYGPYDLPINDYVEPDGSRGYGPDAFGDAIERALHAIADRHFASGPARARLAFAGAQVEVATMDAIHERLDRDPAASRESRMIVRSGSTGQRSRVAFVCPGKPDDPAGVAEEELMNRMCPTKYGAEASAGLGLTGRWAGYLEVRGNERFGLSRMLGWTRSDDAIGRELVEREVRIWAFAVLALALVLGGFAAAAPAHGLFAAGAVASAALVLATAAGLLLAVGGDPKVALVEAPSPWRVPFDPRIVLPLLVLFVGALHRIAFASPSAYDRAELTSASPRSTAARNWSSIATRAATIVIVVGTVGVAAHLASDPWIRPDLFGTDGGLAFERFVLGAGDAIGERFGRTILEIEGAIAAVLLAVVVALLVVLARMVARTAAQLARPRADHAPTRLHRVLPSLVPVLTIAAAAALVVSRKTEGAAALMPAAMAAIVVLGSGVSALAASCDPAGRARWRVAAVVHVGWIAAAFAFSWHAFARLPAHPFVTICMLSGFLVLLGAFTLLATPRPRSAAPTATDRLEG